MIHNFLSPGKPDSLITDLVGKTGEIDALEGDFEKRRLPRLNLTTEQFRLAATGKIFSVADLSPDGMALRILERVDLALFPVGMAIEGTLNLNRQKFQCTARVKNVGTERIGCQFENLAPTSRAALTSLLDPVKLGSELKPIPAVESGTLWYQGPSGTDLVFWRGNDGQYLRFTLIALGNFIGWKKSDGIATGRVSSTFEPSEIRGVVRFETMLFENDARPDLNKLQVAKNLLLGSNLPKDLISWSLRQLKVD